jgi:glycosyltransferase involved in cell wall biosynthesis
VALKVLIPFNTVSLYGMERGVIETFDLLRPEIDAHFLLSYTIREMNLPLLAELQGRGLEYSFFSDLQGWPRIAKPRSIIDCWKMVRAMVLGNRDVFKAAKDKDVIYLPGERYFLFAILASLRHRLQNREQRIVYHFHDLILKRSMLLGLVSHFVTDFVHNTELSRIAVTRPNAYLRKKQNWVIPCPIQPRLEMAANETVEIGSDTFNILFVGQIAKHKGIDLLLDAHELLRQSQPKVVLHIVGNYQDEDSAIRIKEAVHRNVGIKYWGYRDDVLEIMKMVDVYVHPSPPSRFSESFGRGVVEAMSTGTPVVCFRSGALEEIVIHEQTGLVCTEESAADLARNLSRFLNSADLRNRCGRLARVEFEENYNSPSVKARWMELFELKQ